MPGRLGAAFSTAGRTTSSRPDTVGRRNEPEITDQEAFVGTPSQDHPHAGRDARLRRRVRRLVVLAALLLTTVIVAGSPVYVHPQIDPLRHADAILILGGKDYRRYPFGMELGTQGWAPNLVVSNPNGPDDQWLTHYCATPNAKFQLRCFVPDPPTTKGEGRELHRLASRYGWHTVIVVTFRPHISRARFILQHCFDGDLIMVASPADISVPGWAFEYLYQTAGYAREVLQPGC